MSARIIEDSRYYTTAQVAAWLEHTVKWFHRHRKAMEKKGFPKPKAGLLGQPRYRGGDLLDWDRRRDAVEGMLDTSVIDLAQIARARSAALLRPRKAS